MSTVIGQRVVHRAGQALALAACLLVLLAADTSHAAASRLRVRADFVVIVNESNPMTEIDRDALSKIFLKRATSWPSGKLVLPVDLPIDDNSRNAFSRVVLHKTINAVRAYWQQQIFSGRDVPPVEKASEAEVLAAVKSSPDAIGYLSATVVLPAGVKAITVSGIDE